MSKSELPFSLPEIADGENKSSAFLNCLRNSYRNLRKFAKRTCTNCFRLYDKEIARLPVAIDFYGGKFCIHYYSKVSDRDDPEDALVNEVNDCLYTLFRTPPDCIFWRTRAKTKEMRQYEKIGESRAFFTVYEYGVKFLVNLSDYLDTGLFLDHRETRRLVAEASNGKRVLNLFAYTCSFSVHAAMKGATYTKSVDLSNTYTRWGEKNFEINGFSRADHKIVRADCLKFLEDESKSLMRYDVVILDPPTISRSKKMDKLFDIQIEYSSLILQALGLLNENGKIFFSTNLRKFKFDETLFKGVKVEEISHKTLPLDFRNQKIHRCWLITKH